ncbi:MAG: oxygen-independent coproporphyrinogen III oxidase [bacterium]|nr:oxygen-independent coproporphyrinogen III oxidase [bacterium]
MTTTPLHAKPEIDRGLIQKYSMRGPRYTSYPTAPEWKEDVGEAAYWRHIEETNHDGATEPISLYIHVPFCSERCYFCGCNVIITSRDDIHNNYVDLVTLEASRVAERINKNRPVTQFHLGGGTPTEISPAALERLLNNVKGHFRFTEDAELSIEVDLRVTTEAHLDALRRCGFNRISMGVQDFSEQTQTAINRIQSAEATRDFVRMSRDKGFISVNIDLVYGLPHQSTATFGRTLDTIFEIDPDRIALYNYAYLPSKLGHQRRILEEWLPSAEERFNIFQLAVDRFTENGFVYIGMDHFAKPGDELTIAQREGTLQRNFMGFTTRAGADMYSFGVSSISSLPALYIQNIKKLHSYEKIVREGALPIERGCELSLDDRMRRWVIMELMCNLRLPIARFNQTWGVDFHEYFAEEIPRLKPFIEDGLLDPNLSEELRVLDLGRIIIRPIAMTFDYYLTQARKTGRQTPTFSKTL